MARLHRRGGLGYWVMEGLLGIALPHPAFYAIAPSNVGVPRMEGFKLREDIW